MAGGGRGAGEARRLRRSPVEALALLSVRGRDASQRRELSELGAFAFEGRSRHVAHDSKRCGLRPRALRPCGLTLSLGEGEKT